MRVDVSEIDSNVESTSRKVGRGRGVVTTSAALRKLNSKRRLVAQREGKGKEDKRKKREREKRTREWKRISGKK